MNGLRFMATCFIAALLLWTKSAEAQWLRAESPNFIIYSQDSEEQVRTLAALLEDFDQLLRALTATRTPPSPNKLHVYMVRGNGQLREVAPHLSRDVAGFYIAGPTGIAAFADSQMRFSDRRSDPRLHTLFHEYAHHFMLQYFPATYPPWYVEGFAEFMMNTRIEGPVIEYGGITDGRARWLTMGRWEDMDRILFEPQRTGIDMFYAQSWITVHYLFRSAERRAALVNYITAYGRGEDPRQAFERAFGMRPSQLQAELRSYVRGRGIPVTRLTRSSVTTPPPITVTRLPPSADNLLLLDAGFMIGLFGNRTSRKLAELRRAAAGNVNDRYALQVLARAEALYGDTEAAGRTIARLLAETPDNASLHYLSGVRHLRIAQTVVDDAGLSLREAQRAFVQAHRLDPNHFPTLFAYAQSLRGEPNYISENTSNILLLAQQLAPQVATLRFAAAIMLMNRDEFEQAEILLAPLAADLHRAGMAAQAQELIARARARERPGNQEPSVETGRSASPDAEESAPVGKDDDVSASDEHESGRAMLRPHSNSQTAVSR